MLVPGMNVIHAYNMMKAGFLPNPGTYVDQPSTLIEAFDVLEYETAYKQREEIRRNKA